MYRTDAGSGAGLAAAGLVGEADAGDDSASGAEPPEQAERVPKAIIALTPTSRLRRDFLMPSA
jgi:hypothetical protein